MVEGHCLIVTLQHVVQSTACDEDVLEEINVSQKSMFYINAWYFYNLLLFKELVLIMHLLNSYNYLLLVMSD